MPRPGFCSPALPQSRSMAFFSTQKEHKIKRSLSAERIRSNPTGPIVSTPSFAASIPPIRARSSSRPKTSYDVHPTEVHVQGPDLTHLIPKPSATTSPSRRSLRRIPVPSLSIRDVTKIPHDRPRTSPIIPSPRSASRESSIANISGATTATTSKTKPDHLNSLANERIPAPPHSSHWESSVLVCSLQNVAPPVTPPKPVSQKPQRAVLRRKSNAQQPPKHQSIFPSLSHKKSKPDLGISPITATPQRTTSSAHQSPRLASTPVLLDATHRVRRSRSDERKPRSPGNLSPSLTPAGAVAAAYKEQERRRKDLKEISSANTDSLSSKGSCDENGGAYYTVFGSSGKVVAIGTPEDGGRPRGDLSSYTPNKPKPVSRKPSLGALGKLSRKSSTKAKKSGAGSTHGSTSETECGHEKITKDDQVGRISFGQGRRSISLPGKQRSKKPPGLSIDHSDAGTMWNLPQSITTPSKSARGSLDDSSPSTGGKIWKLMKRISTGGLKDKYNAHESAPPVPALPEGLLPAPPIKPKPKTRSVPHSPNDSKPQISRYIRGRSSFGDAPFSNRHRNTQVVSSPTSSHRPPTLSSGKNPSHRRPSTNTRCSSPVSSDMASSKYWQKSRSSSVSTFEEMPPLPERVMKIGPILSPVELCKLEKEQVAVEFSSPPSTVDSHSPASSPSNNHRNTLIIIRKPSLRGMHTRSNGDDSETDGVSTTDFVALPSPPRHRYRSNPHVVYHQSNDSSPVVGSVSTSPTIPMFSTHDVVNQFRLAKGSNVGISRSLNSSSTSQSTGISSNEFGAATPVQPPPRPRRSDRRNTLVANPCVTARASHDHERDSRDRQNVRGKRPSTAVPYPKERMLGVSPELGDDDLDGRSYGTFGSHRSKGLVGLVKTSQDSSSSRENLRSSSSIHSRSPLRSGERESGEREIDRKVWTEKEKADRWDDLLEKSDKAGGTIRIGNAKLLSDSLRFSDYSTMTLSAL